MKVKDALTALLEDESIIVGDKTFVPESVDAIELKTGETVYWVRDGGDIWLALDPSAEEVILFTDIEEQIDATQEVAVYAGDDYEFTYEASGNLVENGEEVDQVMLREFERNDGAVLRVTEYDLGNEIRTATGRKIPEEALKEIE